MYSFHFLTCLYHVKNYLIVCAQCLNYPLVNLLQSLIT